jgi:lysine N6-hydroxylase
MSAQVLDAIGIGLGPFNLGLACLAAPLTGLEIRFLEQKSEFDWHPGLMLTDARLQVPFLADLVTMADPSSPYSFLAYLKDVGRLYPFYIRENFYPLRAEYADYCRWATGRLRTIQFGRQVERVEHDPARGCYVVTSRDVRSGEQHQQLARRLIIGTGTPPRLPSGLQSLGGPARHSSQYLDCRHELRGQDSITVVGSGQSAAEVFHDLLLEVDRYGYELQWVTRSARFFPLEYTKLTLELTSPEYVRYFHELPASRRAALLAGQTALYKGISRDLIDSIYELLYQRGRRPGPRVRLLTNTSVESAQWDGASYTLDLRHEETDEAFRLSTGGLVLATGYQTQLPDFLAPVHHRIRWDESGQPDAHPHYAIDHDGRELFVQNIELPTHGIATPDLGMGAYRNSVILREILGHAPYPIEKRIAFQEFGVPADLAPGVRR